MMNLEYLEMSCTGISLQILSKDKLETLSRDRRPTG
jgi:hypothetical protein